ncbi:MAG: penicillin-binding transpeptidase domain-containing protein [Pseudobdellovibrio sp.]
MIQGRTQSTKWILVPTTLIISAFFFFKDDVGAIAKNTELPLNKPSEARKIIAASLEKEFLFNKLPEKLKLTDQSLDSKSGHALSVTARYSFESELQNEATKLLQRYKPDYGAIVMMDAKTGQVLAMSSFIKTEPAGQNLNLRATFPAASIFKIITAATAVDRKGVDPHHQIAFNGGNYTLYKKNVLSERITKWTRFITLKDAFAKSINTAFGRLTLENIDPHDLSEYAKRFMFNKYIPADFNVEFSQASIPEEKGFELTQVASGYNRFNTLSPVHGAMIAGAIINDGKFVAPYIVDELVSENDNVVYKAEPYEIGQAITAESAKKVREMMEQTVLAGTSRKTFRQILKDKKFREVEMGGKTGHFSGLNPRGRNDWFVGYASDGDNKVAIAAITVNVKKWTVKSSALAEMMFRKHFKTILEEKEISKKLNQQQQDNDQTLLVETKPHKI